MKSALGDAAAAVFFLAVLYMLVRPGSPGPSLIGGVTSAFNDLVHLATQG